MGKTVRWPEEHVTYLRKLVAAGVGDAVMADALNTAFGTRYTRNGIIGKRHRLKLYAPKQRDRAPVMPPPPNPRLLVEPDPKPRLRRQHRAKPAKNATPAKRLKTWQAPRPELRAVPVKPLEGGPHVAGIPLILREPHQCGWPVDDGGPHLFCGMPKAASDPNYCPYHRRLATRKVRMSPPQNRDSRTMISA